MLHLTFQLKISCVTTQVSVFGNHCLQPFAFCCIANLVFGNKMLIPNEYRVVWFKSGLYWWQSFVIICFCCLFMLQIHTLVESLKLSISDQQLPMFIRIMQLGIALYYGEIGNFKDGESEDLICHNKDMLGNITGQYSC